MNTSTYFAEILTEPFKLRYNQYNHDQKPYFIMVLINSQTSCIRYTDKGSSMVSNKVIKYSEILSNIFEYFIL